MGSEPTLDDEHTRIVTFARSTEIVPDERVRCLEVIDGVEVGRRFVVGPAGARIGRTQPAEIVLVDSEVSRAHCRLMLEGDTLMVADLNSTNGTFVDGVRVREPTALVAGAILRVGRQSLKHEWRTQKEIFQAEELERDLKKANLYVLGLLPEPLREGPIRIEWHYEPCAKLGGDAFGYGALSERQFAFFMIDISGHGAGAAMHSVAVMNILRKRALPGTDMANPAAVLAALNAMFPMEEHAEMYFTMWYGVFDRESRQLDFATAGHHPAFLIDKTRRSAAALRARGGLIGAVSGARYTAERVVVPQRSMLYLFSDGVFEIVTIDGLECGLNDFVPVLLEPPVEGLSESQRLYRAVRRQARPGLDDDFSMMVLEFD